MENGDMRPDESSYITGIALAVNGGMTQV